MRILFIGYHNGPAFGGWPGHMVPGPSYRLAVGFEELGHTVVRHDVRDDRFAGRMLEGEPFDVCLLSGQQLRRWHEQGTWLPRIAELMPVVVNYTDVRDEPEPWFEFAAVHAELVLHIAGGRCLEGMLEGGFKRAAFMPLPPYDWGELEQVPRDMPWFFSGSDTALGDGCRKSDLAVVVDEVGAGYVCAPGMYGRPTIAGHEHAKLMARASRGLCVSHFHDRPKYTSTRTFQYMLAGIDVVVRRFDGCEKMLPDEPIVYGTHDELVELIRRPRDEERVQRLRAFTREHYGPAELARVALAYMAGDDPGVVWGEQRAI